MFLVSQKINYEDEPTMTRKSNIKPKIETLHVLSELLASQNYIICILFYRKF